MKHINYLFLLFLLFVCLSCVTNKAAADSSKAALKTAIESNERALKMLDLMAEQSKKAEQEGRIATSANAEIQQYVASEKEKITAQTIKLQQSKEALEKSTNVSSKELTDANNEVFNNDKALRIIEEKTKIIIDFLGNETFSKSEIGALFNSGEFKLFKEQKAEGEKLFRPIVDKIFNFANKYQGKQITLKGEIIVTGYSDATPIDKKSKLGKELSNILGIENPTSSQLNQELSELRAIAVKELLEATIAKRKSVLNESLEVNVSTLGRGEELPPGLAENIPRNDFRRRVVTFYWVVLPKF